MTEVKTEQAHVGRPWGDPYWYAKDDLPGIDFNRQIIEPGTNPKFPGGAVGIYVDDDFWSVAALPLDQYRDTSVQAIVQELWPHYANDAEFTPDHGSIEQRIYQAEQYAESCKEREEYVYAELFKLREELDRYRIGRVDVAPRSRTKEEMQKNYFVRQYEHLLTVFAHRAVPRTDKSKGLCSICGLANTDTVHTEHWIEKRREGFDFSLDWAGSYPDAQADRNPEGHDPEEGHGAEHESPVAAGDAPDLGSYSSIPLERIDVSLTKEGK